MARYTIEDTTLTALGDAIRAHVGETKPAIVEAIYDFTATGNNTVGKNDWVDRAYDFAFRVPGASQVTVKDIVITTNTSPEEITFKVGYASDGRYNSLPLPVYVYGSSDTPSEITRTASKVNGGLFFVAVRCPIEKTDITISLTVTGLDAEGNVLINKEIEIPYLMTPNKMIEELNNINTFPAEKFYLTGDLTSRFAYNGWNWFIEQFGDKIITENITSLNSTFVNSSKLKEIPFDLHCRISSSGASPFNQTFSGCSELIKFPNIYIHTNAASAGVMLDNSINEEQNIFLDDNVSIYGFEYNAFSGAKLKKEPDWLFSQCNWDQIRTNTKNEFGTGFPVEWSQAYYVKELPSFSNFYSEGTSNYYSHWYSLKLVSCYNLQNIVLPRPGKCAYSSTPNAFGNMTYLTSLKNLTFDVQEDGTPYTAQWKNTTLSLHNYIGYAYTLSYVDATKQVTDDESYQRLKNDPAHWTGNIKYACYNHDSAVNTINSLPDTSAYGTNTIKFKGSAGSATDGGAINILTEEEIAVATAKGWTVTFV